LKNSLDKIEANQRNTAAATSIDDTCQHLTARITDLEHELNIMKQKHALLEDNIYRLEGEIKHLKGES
jgi:predicted  nucleic acid-binding Zn-ribbon protein